MRAGLCSQTPHCCFKNISSASSSSVGDCVASVAGETDPGGLGFDKFAGSDPCGGWCLCGEFRQCGGLAIASRRISGLAWQPLPKVWSGGALARQCAGVGVGLASGTLSRLSPRHLNPLPIRGIFRRPSLVECVLGPWITRRFGSCRPGIAQCAGGDCLDQCAASTGVD